MNEALLMFLREQCPENLRRMQQVTNVNYNIDVTEEQLLDLYSRLINSYITSGLNPAPDELKDNYIQLLKTVYKCIPINTHKYSIDSVVESVQRVNIINDEVAVKILRLNELLNDEDALITGFIRQLSQFSSKIKSNPNLSENNLNAVKGLIGRSPVERVAPSYKEVVDRFDSDDNLEKFNTEEVLILLNEEKISVKQALAFFTKHAFNWEQLKEVLELYDGSEVPIVLQDLDNYEVLFDLLTMCDKGIQHLYEQFEINDLTSFTLFIKERQNHQGLFNIEELPSEKVNLLFESNLVGLDKVASYYKSHPRTITCENCVKYSNDIHSVIMALIEGEQYEKLTELICRDERIMRSFFNEYQQADFISGYISYLLNNGYSADDLYKVLPVKNREGLFISTLENDSLSFDQRKELLSNFFRDYEAVLTMDLYADLFNKNYYFNFILSAFRTKLFGMDKESMLSMSDGAANTRAWTIANEIINSFLG